MATTLLKEPLSANNGIRLDLASVSHPQSNGQEECANQEILHGIKSRLIEKVESSLGCWVDELPAVLWSLRTTPNRSTGSTPYFMVYRAEIVMSSDIIYDSPRVAAYVETDNEIA